MPFHWGKGLVSPVHAQETHVKPEITVKLPYGEREIMVGLLICVKMVQAPPDSQ